MHAALVQSSLAAGWAFGTPLSAHDSDRYVAEMMVAAELVGVPGPLVPGSVADLERYVASVRHELRCTPAAAESMAYLLDPPGPDEELAGSGRMSATLRSPCFLSGRGGCTVTARHSP